MRNKSVNTLTPHRLTAAFFEDEGEIEWTISAVLNKSHFENQPWEVECTDKVVQFLKDQCYSAALKEP